jgi:hypothetical protein
MREGGEGQLMTFRNALSKLTFPACLLFNRRSRRAVQGLMMLRRAYEHVLVMAALEGARDVPRPYYEAYVDALELLGTRALLVASGL